MEKKSIWENPWLYIVIVAIVVLIMVFWGNITGNVISGSGDYDTFATCLTDYGAVMYGTDWCSHCKDQKAAFGNSFKDINYVNCDSNKRACTNAFVTGYPTWVIDGQKYPGTQQLSRLASLTGCELVKDV